MQSVSSCPVMSANRKTALDLALQAIAQVSSSGTAKPNVVWLETNGCSGNIMSLMNAVKPNLQYLLEQMVTLQYNNSLMAAEGQAAYDRFRKAIAGEFILIVEGAISTRDDGQYTIIANDNGTPVTALSAVQAAGARATHIIAVGTCACFGGITAADPNTSQSLPLDQVLTEQTVIKLPGCPTNPAWVIGTIANLLLYGVPELDRDNRPTMFYAQTIHARCPRRSYYDNREFAEKMGDPECMYKLGCKGPWTHTDCPIRRWNDTENWPVGNNTPCIGCAYDTFPDFAPDPLVETQISQ